MTLEEVRTLRPGDLVRISDGPMDGGKCKPPADMVRFFGTVCEVQYIDEDYDKHYPVKIVGCDYTFHHNEVERVEPVAFPEPLICEDVDTKLLFGGDL